MPRKTANALPARISVFILTAKTKPATEQTPTTSVMAISMVVKLPDTMCAHPSKNSQMSPIRNSQKKKQGSAVHLVYTERRIPRTAVGQTGAVCTM
jgi:hypothetical protein